MIPWWVVPAVATVFSLLVVSVIAGDRETPYVAMAMTSVVVVLSFGCAVLWAGFFLLGLVVEYVRSL